MLFLHKLMARSLRPRAFHSPTFSGILRRNQLTPSAKPLPTNFYTSSIYHRSMTRRFYSSHRFSHEKNSTLNTYVIYGAIGLNCAICLYANYAQAQARQGSPGNSLWFYENFTLNYDGVTREGRWWTVITSVFAHTSPMHLFGNMATTYFLGLVLAHTPGIRPGMLVSLILGSGLCGSMFYLGFRRYQIQIAAEKRPWGHSAPRDYKRGLGFSGAVMGVSAVAAAIHPRMIIHLWGIVPLPLWALVTGYAVTDMYYFNDSNSRTAHSGHIGGLVFGMGYYLAKLRGF